MLAVWSFARSFGPALQLHPFTLEDLCTALERDAPIRHSTRDAAGGRPLDDTPTPDEPPRIAPLLAEGGVSSGQGVTPLLAELHVRLLRAVLRDAGQLRATEQLPTPLEAGLLQQLPTAETVTPANWPEMLRAVGLLTSLARTRTRARLCGGQP